MAKTKQTGCRSGTGMQQATFSNQPETQQFKDIPEEDTLDPTCQAAQQAVKQGEASKSTGKTGAGEGTQAVDKPTPEGAEGGAEASPTAVQASTEDPKPGTSTDPTDPQEPRDNNEPRLATYVNSYQAAPKIWFDTVQDSKEQAYITLYDMLLQIGDPHISKLCDSDRQTVLNCIADKSGKYLSEDDFAVYVSKEDTDFEKKSIKLVTRQRHLSNSIISQHRSYVRHRQLSCKVHES